MTTIDPQTGQLIADDAADALTAFRTSGGKPFHELGVEGARKFYESSCATNGLHGDFVSRVEDIDVDGKCAVRIYDPRQKIGEQPSPVIVFIHGGGWTMGSLATHDSLCRRLATQTDFPVVAIDYRLAPEHPYPAAINDCRTVLRWLASSSAHWLIPHSIILMGDSAGGQLAASLAIESTTTNTNTNTPVTAQVLLYPVTDLVIAGTSYQRITSGFALTADTMRWFAELYLPSEVNRATPDISPLRATLPRGIPRTFICTVDNDPLANEGIRYAAALANSGTEVHSIHLAGYAHGLFTSAGVIQRGEQLIGKVASFITESQV